MLKSGTRVADGEFCFYCGHASEAFWPLTPDAVRAKYLRDSDFRTEFASCREAARSAHQALEREFKEESIAQSKLSGFKVCIPVGLIPLDVFNIAMKVPAESVPNLKVVTVPCPAGGPEIEGALMRLKDIPPSVPHYEAELFTTKTLTYTDSVLTPDRILRRGQATDEFKARCELAAKDRGPPAPLKGKMQTNNTAYRRRLRRITAAPCLLGSASVAKCLAPAWPICRTMYSPSRSGISSADTFGRMRVVIRRGGRRRRKRRRRKRPLGSLLGSWGLPGASWRPLGGLLGGPRLGLGGFLGASLAVLGLRAFLARPRVLGRSWPVWSRLKGLIRAVLGSGTFWGSGGACGPSWSLGGHLGSWSSWGGLPLRPTWGPFGKYSGIVYSIVAFMQAGACVDVCSYVATSRIFVGRLGPGSAAGSRPPFGPGLPEAGSAALSARSVVGGWFPAAFRFRVAGGVRCVECGWIPAASSLRTSPCPMPHALASGLFH